MNIHDNTKHRWILPIYPLTNNKRLDSSFLFKFPLIVSDYSRNSSYDAFRTFTAKLLLHLRHYKHYLISPIDIPQTKNHYVLDAHPTFNPSFPSSLCSSLKKPESCSYGKCTMITIVQVLIIQFCAFLLSSLTEELTDNHTVWHIKT